MIPKLWSLVGIRLYERYPPEEDSSSSTATSIATYMGMRFPKVSPLISGNYHIETIILGANVGTCPGQLQVDKNNQSGDIPNLGGQFISVDLTYTTHRLAGTNENTELGRSRFREILNSPSSSADAVRH
ncbi:hypothetical protein V6N12_010330 [Hibiscus sabdariffa]|uniref:Uncharacterized protein n=1 Tax=Hibiscus sabdariffa TaxID=183260 RepID=A0ABR2EJS3_9ROSI